MVTFNDHPHPRVLFEHVPDDVVKMLQPLAAYSERIRIQDSVHESDFDLLITFAKATNRRSPHLHVLSIGGDQLGDGGEYRRHHETTAMLVTVESGELPEMAKLAEATIAPFLGAAKKTWVRRYPDPKFHAYVQSNIGTLHGGCEPIVSVGSERYPVAWLSVGETLGRRVCLALPAETTQVDKWLALFLQYLHSHDAERFPPRWDWRCAAEWASAETRDLMKERSTSQQAWDSANAAFARAQADVDDRLEQARARDVRGIQQLLASDGDDLEAAVVGALEALGFNVTAMDEHHDAVSGARLEDLRVSDIDDSDWICLAEVKGYSKGAKVRDVAQVIGRPVVGFLKEVGREPSAVWHIVNANRGENPSSRPKAIPDDRDLKALADANGVLIDTRDLFRAVRGVQAGGLEAAVVRRALRDARSRWVFIDDSSSDY
jgi:hypothetical protein